MNVWADKEIEIAGSFKKTSQSQGTQFYSTMIETEAAFAERTIRSLRSLSSTVTCKVVETSKITNVEKCHNIEL